MENQQQYSVHVHGPLDLFKELIKVSGFRHKGAVVWRPIITNGSFHSISLIAESTFRVFGYGVSQNLSHWAELWVFSMDDEY